MKYNSTHLAQYYQVPQVIDENFDPTGAWESGIQELPYTTLHPDMQQLAGILMSTFRAWPADPCNFSS